MPIGDLAVVLCSFLREMNHFSAFASVLWYVLARNFEYTETPRELFLAGYSIPLPFRAPDALKNPIMSLARFRGL